MNRIAAYIVAAVLAVWSVINVLSGASGLMNSKTSELSMNSPEGTICEFKVRGAMEAFHVEHKWKKFLPVGTEHFYLVFLEDSWSPLLVKASKGWYNRHFDSKGIAKSEFTVKGEVRDHAFGSVLKLAELNISLKGDGVKGLENGVSVDHYVDSLYKTRCVVKILSGVLLLGAGFLLLFVFQRYGGDLSYTPVKVCVIGAGAAAIGGIVLFVLGLTALR